MATENEEFLKREGDLRTEAQEHLRAISRPDGTGKTLAPDIRAGDKPSSARRHSLKGAAGSVS